MRGSVIGFDIGKIRGAALKLLLAFVLAVGLVPAVNFAVPQYAEAATPQHVMTWPAPGYYGINTCFMGKYGGYDSTHDAIDINCPKGASVVAAYDGVVSGISYYDGSSNYWGNQITLRHTINGQTIYTRYVHWDDVTVKNGDSVKAGQVIAHAGTSGNVRAHLDFKVLDSNGTTRLDPSEWLTSGGNTIYRTNGMGCAGCDEAAARINAAPNPQPNNKPYGNNEVTDLPDEIKCFIKPAGNTNYALDVQGAKTYDGANLQLYTAWGSEAQQFTFHRQSDGTYCISCGTTGSEYATYIGLSSWDYNADNNVAMRFTIASWDMNRWYVEKTPDGYYSFRNVWSGKYLDVANASFKDYTNIQQCSGNGSMAQKFVLEFLPYKGNVVASDIPTETKCSIKPAGHENYALDVQGGVTYDGANLQLNNAWGSEAQQFKFSRNDDGTYCIYCGTTGSEYGTYIGLSSWIYSSGTNVAMRFVIPTWSMNRWYVEKTPDGYYSFRNCFSGKYLEVQNANYANHANIYQNAGNGRDSQKFTIEVLSDEGNVVADVPTEVEYYIKPAGHEDYALDVQGGVTYDGANLQLYTANNSEQQRFTFYRMDDGTYCISCGTSGSEYATLIGLAGWSTNAGTSVAMRFWITTWEMNCWYVEKTPDGYYSFRNAYSGKYMDVSGAKYENGRDIIQYDGNGGGSQKFVLSPVHAHVWGEGVVTTEPGCETEGVRTYVCQEDETHTKTETIAALGHNVVNDMAVEATCAEAGKTEGSHCGRCNEVFVAQQTIDALGHEWGEYASDGDATCEADGTKTRECSRCGGFETVADEGSALGHKWDAGTVTTEPGCETEGVLTYACANDGTHTYTEAIPALGHAWDGGTVTTAPTATEDGVRTYTCANDPAHTRTEAVPATGEEPHVHALKKVPAKAATCEEPGNIEYWMCDGCGAVYANAAMTAQISLDDVATEPVGHEWGEWSVVKAATVAEPGTEQRVCARDASHVETREVPYVSDDPVEAFAVRLYTEILDRDPDPEGLAAQVNALRSGWSPAEIAYNYFNGPEYFLKHESPEQTVERVYRVMFGRDSDEAGKAFWVGKMEDGMSVRAVVAGFSQAQEYRDYFGSIGLSADEIPVYRSYADQAWDDEGDLTYAGGNGRDLNQGAAAFAKRMYTVVLGRTDIIGVEGGIDVAGLNVQAQAIANGMPCWQIAMNFFGSAEFAAKPLTNQQVVEIGYAAILGRDEAAIASDVEGKAYWVERLRTEGIESMVRGFCQSDEFDNVCRLYGLTSGMR